MTFPWLTVLGLLPIIGSLLTFFLKGKFGKIFGLIISLATLGVAAYLAWWFKPAQAGFQFVEDLPWIKQIGTHYSLGMDGMSLLMVLLAVVLVPLVFIAEWRTMDERGRWSGHTFMALALMLEGFSIYVFTATDILLFYLMFEATLIPMYFLISGFGGSRRSAAALKFLLYSLAGGLIMLVSVVGLYAVSAGQGGMTSSYAQLMGMNLDGTVGRWLMLGFLIAFIIKAPMFPVHTWLPDTAEQATPGTSALLVGVLDKIGTFGMLRYCLGLFPEASSWIAPIMIILALISVIYGAVVALGQKNLLRLVSYTSVSHFGLIVLGIYAFTTPSLNGSVFYMLNHGFSIAALFLVVGMLVQRRGSAEIPDFGGVQSKAPWLASMFLVSGLTAIALPGFSGFVSEFLVLTGSWSRHPGATLVAIFAMVLAALYILMTYQRTMTGEVTEATEKHFVSDMTCKEKLVLAPLLLIMLVLGFFPQPVLQVTDPLAQATMTQVQMTDVNPAGKVEK